jgi:uncharacterized membrane protein YfcA
MVFVLIGLAAGVLAGMFGVGGGIIIVPALLFFAKFEPQTATGTSLTALLLPVGFLGVWAFYKKGHINVPAALWVALGLFVGIYFGAQIALTLPARTLQRGFAVFMVLVAAKTWLSA